MHPRLRGVFQNIPENPGADRLDYFDYIYLHREENIALVAGITDFEGNARLTTICVVEADNKLEFFNSFKMKMSVIFGVLQMTVGVLLKGSNAIYYKSLVDFFFEFIPQLVFIMAMFVYMDFMIIVKWNVQWDNDIPPDLI